MLKTDLKHNLMAVAAALVLTTTAVAAAVGPAQVAAKAPAAALVA